MMKVALILGELLCIALILCGVAIIFFLPAHIVKRLALGLLAIFAGVALGALGLELLKDEFQ